jgi:tetratricopeptide (TPR) repeat protein
VGEKVFAAFWRPRWGLFTAVASLMLAGSPALAAGPAAPYVPGPDNCLLAKNPDAKKICQMARTEYFKGNYQGAMTAINRAVSLSPKEGILHVVQTTILIRFETLGPAERAIREARQEGVADHIALPLLFNVMVLRSEELNLLNEFPEPAASAKGQVASDILQGRARALLSLGRLLEAATAMDRSLALSRDADGLLLRSDIALKQKDNALADKLVDEAYRLDPKSAQAMAARLKRLQRANDTAGVLAISDQMIALYPIYSEPVVAKVDIFLKQNQDAKAKAEIDAYLNRRPRAGVGLYYKALLLSRAKDKKGAAQIVQAFPIQFAKDNPQYALSMAQMALDNGSVETGAAILGAGIGGAPDRTDLRLKLAQLRLDQNSPQSALLVLSPAENSKDPQVQKMLKQLRARIAKDRSF